VDAADGMLDVGWKDAHRVQRQRDACNPSRSSPEQREGPAISHTPVASTTSRGNGTKSSTIGRNLSGATRWTNPATK
jgi:hypothetical protein